MAQRNYVMLTVDTEALPMRASQDHVKRLIWGEHENGTAGVRELCSIGNEFNARHLFFVDLCGAHKYSDEMLEVVRWLDNAGQDVQLHAHPEVLPQDFWVSHEMDTHPLLMDEYRDESRAEFVVRHFGELISKVTQNKILAFRAGSFRWNANVIRALGAAGIPLSFNNSMRAFNGRQCVFSEPTNYPFLWSNGVIEIPVTETLILPRPGGKAFWTSLTYPESAYFPFKPEQRPFLQRLFGNTPSITVFLLHSWSLLCWDEHGHAVYLNDQRLEGYRALLAKLAKDYDIITSNDFLDLHSRGKIPINKTVGLEHAELSR